MQTTQVGWVINVQWRFHTIKLLNDKFTHSKREHGANNEQSTTNKKWENFHVQNSNQHTIIKALNAGNKCYYLDILYCVLYKNADICPSTSSTVL